MNYILTQEELDELKGTTKPNEFTKETVDAFMKPTRVRLSNDLSGFNEEVILLEYRVEDLNPVIVKALKAMVHR